MSIASLQNPVAVTLSCGDEEAVQVVLRCPSRFHRVVPSSAESHLSHQLASQIRKTGKGMDEASAQTFWNTSPCGDHLVGGLRGEFSTDYKHFFAAYDSWRYRQESDIPECLDLTEWLGRRVLEIGLGRGADAEPLIRRGARWSGSDLTQESVARAFARLAVRNLPCGDLRRGSALAIPWPDNTFGPAFSHGWLHHIPDIHKAQAEIHRVSGPGGSLIAMQYARDSLNYQVSIRVLRRVSLAAAYPLRRARWVRSNDRRKAIGG